MTKLIGIEIYSFSMEEGFNDVKTYVVDDAHTNIRLLLYRFGGYVNADAIEVVFEIGKIYHIIKNGNQDGQVHLVKIVFSGGSSIYTSKDNLEKIIFLSSDGAN
ncbi:hypothetical protein [Methylorubrum sp. SL192]|jgi:hypothetical protein|uniref:hypothetical protein n=1 Tax=Methylorubrum sp. SL192 TaxID=2995167 RepID=UPI00227633CD|nr:hypothetical protein [Methylorubrum sp. SL192]MCY1640697.1 hypothetical protein [Methylorubrum sp. SL192]